MHHRSTLNHHIYISYCQNFILLFIIFIYNKKWNILNGKPENYDWWNFEKRISYYCNKIKRKCRLFELQLIFILSLQLLPLLLFRTFSDTGADIGKKTYSQLKGVIERVKLVDNVVSYCSIKSNKQIPFNKSHYLELQIHVYRKLVEKFIFLINYLEQMYLL